MRFDVLTLFPAMFDGVLGASILKRAAEPLPDRPAVVSYHLHDIRDWTTNKHQKVDAAPFGGGPGMVMQCQPVWDAVQAVEAMDPRVPTRVLLTPTGTPLTQPLVERLAGAERLLLIAGHYEGLDQRVIDRLHEEAPEAADVNPSAPTPANDHLLELSLGDYVLSGGELPAMVLIDAIVRLIPGVLGDAASAHHDSFAAGSQRLLDHPHYTRPRTWAGRDAPDVLLGGDHAAIEAWRREQRERLTLARRPELIEGDGRVATVTLRNARPGDAELIHATDEATLSLVAEHAGQIIGHLHASTMQLLDATTADTRLACLGPLVVTPDWQHRGVESALLREAIARLTADGFAAVVVQDDPAFYLRFGFRPAHEFGITPAKTSDDSDAFQLLPLLDPLPSNLWGRVRYPHPPRRR